MPYAERHARGSSCVELKEKSFTVLTRAITAMLQLNDYSITIFQPLIGHHDTKKGRKEKINSTAADKLLVQETETMF